MCFSKTNLPEEIVLMIFHLLPLWHDRFQFAACCKHNWNCVLKNGSIGQVDLFTEKNLLKFKIARSIVLHSNVAVQEFSSRAVKSFDVCSNLRTFVVKDTLMSSFVINNILKAAGGQKKSIDFIVPKETLKSWKASLNNQKFKEGYVHVFCEYEDEDSVQEIGGVLDEYMSCEDFEALKIECTTEANLSSNANEVVATIGELSIGCIICFEEVKFLISSFDAFVHIPDVDDCSFSNKWSNKRPFAKLHHKFEKGRNFFEVSLIFHGCIELLAVGGIVVVEGESVDAFLGSSIKPLKNNNQIDGDRLTERIYIKSHRQECIRSERLMRQYYKRDSCALWSFHLKKTHDIGFFPVNPLRVDEHPSFDSIALKLQSFIVSSLARKRFDQQAAADLIGEIKTNKDFLNKYLKLDVCDATNFSSLYNALTTDGKWKDMICILKMLEEGQITLGTSKKDIIRNKKFVLEVGNRGFLKALSDINDKNSKIAKARMSS